ncbi:MAG: SLBB domain-containing protein [Deltaproteobacteria bacterium]|nr:SLBB domain-containing protein [Deltaproteobacteria bacterium]
MTALVAAQPLPDPAAADPRIMGGGGDAKIPVTGPGATEVMAAETTGATSTPAPIAIEQPIDPDQYICGPGDVFDLNFWGAQNFRLKIAVDLEGRTFISKVGYVAVAGKTLSAVRTAIKSKVRGQYPGLNFDLTLVAPRTFLVHVVDNVKAPGTFTTHPLERVSTVLSKAGTLPNGSRRRIEVRHRGGKTATADLVLYELTGDTGYNPYLLDGDVVSVPFADPVVAIAGAVRRPGTYELIKSKDLTELLELAGGFTNGVSRTLPIQVVRHNDRQQQTAMELAFAGNAAPNASLHDDDRVYVRGTDEVQRTILLIGAVVGADPLDAATTSKRLAFVEGDTVLSLIERAGGIKAPGDLRRSYISRPRAGKTPELLPLDLDALLVRRDFSADKKIEMGDTIVIPPMQYSVLVEGAVGRSGLYNYNPTFGIAEYIAHAGGRSRTARDLDEVKLIDANGTTHDYRGDLRPAPGDAILVPERNFSRAEVAQLVLAGVGLVLSGVAITIAATR